MMFLKKIYLYLYFFRDIIMLYIIHTLIYNLNIYQYIKIPIYAICQGTIGCAIFLIAHDCGHNAFSNYKLINFIIGLISNTFFLTPYYSWRLGHQNHHINVQDINKDEVYYPYENEHNYIVYIPFGWLWYIILGRGSRGSQGYSFFNLNNPMYNTKKKKQKVLVSILSLAVFIILGFFYVPIQFIIKYYLPTVWVHNM
jgi:acyl-lipid omega-3 desaturase